MEKRNDQIIHKLTGWCGLPWPLSEKLLCREETSTLQEKNCWRTCMKCSGFIKIKEIKRQSVLIRVFGWVRGDMSVGNFGASIFFIWGYAFISYIHPKINSNQFAKHKKKILRNCIKRITFRKSYPFTAIDLYFTGKVPGTMVNCLEW